MEYREDHQGETEADIDDHAAADVAGVYNFFLLNGIVSRDEFGF